MLTRIGCDANLPTRPSQLLHVASVMRAPPCSGRHVCRSSCERKSDCTALAHYERHGDALGLASAFCLPFSWFLERYVLRECKQCMGVVDTRTRMSLRVIADGCVTEVADVWQRAVTHGLRPTRPALDNDTTGLVVLLHDHVSTRIQTCFRSGTNCRGWRRDRRELMQTFLQLSNMRSHLGHVRSRRSAPFPWLDWAAPGERRHPMIRPYRKRYDIFTESRPNCIDV